MTPTTPTIPSKVLCVCAGGNCRSATLAYMLKYHYGVDALAVGVEGNSRDTLMMLCAWAHKIIVVDKTLKDQIPMQHLEKTVIYEVGPDRWFTPPVGLMMLFDSHLIHDPDFTKVS